VECKQEIRKIKGNNHGLAGRDFPRGSVDNLTVLQSYVYGIFCGEHRKWEEAKSGRGRKAVAAKSLIQKEET
jgi:hypothetical protein